VILGTDKIRDLLTNPTEDPSERLVISPLLDAVNQLKSGSASVDIRLGQHFTVPRRTKLSALNHLADDYEKNIQRYKDDYFIAIGDYFVLHPRQFVLGETLEWIHLPSTLAASVVGRSAWGRDGLIIATATGIHPNFSGILTLEIANIGEIPLYLYPGVTIAQLFIMEVTPGIRENPIPSTFQMQTLPHPQNALLRDKAFIEAFKKYHNQS
jgi:dCTP deaminase